MPAARVKRTKYDGGVKGLQQRARSLNRSVQYGVARNAGSYPGGPQVSDVATWNATGTDNIPSRNFYQKFFDDHFRRGTGRKHMPTVVGNFTRQVLAGDVSVKRAVDLIGNTGLKLLREIVKKWKTPPNSAATIKKKGFNDPLIHTKKLLNSLTWWESRAKF